MVECKSGARTGGKHVLTVVVISSALVIANSMLASHYYACRVTWVYQVPLVREVNPICRDMDSFIQGKVPSPSENEDHIGTMYIADLELTEVGNVRNMWK